MFDIGKLEWTREPDAYDIKKGRIEIITKPHTDLWQRTYYHFRNDNAPVLQMRTAEKYFSFTVKTEFESGHRFDQCGVVVYLDSDNWLKGSIEYENEDFQHLGSVVTNRGYSDWATTAIDASVKSMWYRLSRREDDFCIECSEDGIYFSQMRVCHMWDAVDEISFGIYACSPEDSSFKAVFTEMDITDCKWLAHDGQQPDKKSLSEMTLEELWKLFPIILSEHKSCWKDWYDEEKQRIAEILCDEVFKIHHIGSTAINHIWAKPIVDILIEIPGSGSMDDIKEKLINSGYICMSEEENRKSFNKGYTDEGFAERVFHIHLRYDGDNDELYFRDYMNDNPELAKEYERLKLSLWKKYEHNRDAYTDAKSAFVKKYTKCAKADYGNRLCRTQ